MDLHELIESIYDDSNILRLQEHLEEGGDPNHQFSGGITFFMRAICFPINNIIVISELINAGADVNHSSHLGSTPLLLAVYHRKRQVVDKLIELGASDIAKDFLGRTVLHFAVKKWVLTLGSINLQFEPDILIIESLLKLRRIDCNQVNFHGETPLMLAVKNHQIEVIRLLLKNNANPNIGNKLSETPLHVAFSLPGSKLAIELLLGGASIYSVDERGRTPIDVLIDSGLDIRTNEMVNAILKIIVFKYSITRDLKRKLERIPNLSQVFNQYCIEADHMRGDFIYGNITMHDFMCSCFAERDTDVLVHQIHKPVIERLVRDIYPEYFIYFFVHIPKSSLCRILQMIAVKYCHVEDLAYLLSILHINNLISNHLSRYEVFHLIRAFSDVISE